MTRLTIIEALKRIELWTRNHPNGTCEAVNEKARTTLALIDNTKQDKKSKGV